MFNGNEIQPLTDELQAATPLHEPEPPVGVDVGAVVGVVVGVLVGVLVRVLVGVDDGGSEVDPEPMLLRMLSHLLLG